MNDEWLGQLTLDILFNAEEQPLNLADHLLDLDLRAVREHRLSECLLDSLHFLHTYDHVFLGGRLTHCTRWGTSGSWAKSILPILFKLLFNLIEPAHHHGVLLLHQFELVSQCLVLVHLLRVLLVYAL